MTNKKTKGFSLLEAMLVSMAIIVLVAMVYGFYQLVFASERNVEESTGASQLTLAINRSYDSLSNFSGITTQSVVSDKIAPPGFNGNGSVLESPGGYRVAVASETIAGVAGRGFSLTYSALPKKACIDFVAGAVPMQRYTSILVGQTEVSPRGALNEAELTTACSRAPVDVKLTFERNSTGDIASLEQCVVPEAQREELSCQAGYQGEKYRTRTARCEGPYEAPKWNDWETTDGCQITCVINPASPQTQTRACPPGKLGIITDERVSTCPQQTGYPVWGPFEEKSNTCADPCVVPSPSVRNDSNECQTNYGSGFRGSVVYKTTYYCPAETGEAKPLSTTRSDECFRTCQSQVPATNPATRLVRKSRACGSGYSGEITYDEEQQSTYSCADPIANASPSQTAWTATGRVFNENNSACVALCRPETNLEQWVATTGQCQAGFTGGRSWERRQTRTSTCPAGASSPTTSGWSDTGQTRNVVDNCVVICTVPNPSSKSENQTLTNGSTQVAYCSAGFYGYYNQARDVYQTRTSQAYCPQYTGSYAWGAWSGWNTTGYSGCRSTSGSCTGCPANWVDTSDDDGQNRWQARAEGCPSPLSGNASREWEQRQTRVISYNCPAGTTSAPGPTYGAWRGDFSDTGNWRNYSTASCTCNSRVDTQYTNNRTCSSGQRLCEPGQSVQTTTYNCYGQVIAQTPVTVISRPVCVRSNQLCP